MIHLILGGARSGKSTFAEKLAGSDNRAVFYIATATAGDEEMKQRIAHHQNQRPSEWQLIEEPFNLSSMIFELGNSQNVILIDCLTLWLSNWLCREKEAEKASWKSEQELFLSSLEQSESNIYIVSNEVGSGIIPMGELTRRFVDRAGRLNQAVARIANEVTLVVAGLPLSLKETTTAK